MSYDNHFKKAQEAIRKIMELPNFSDKVIALVMLSYKLIRRIYFSNFLKIHIYHFFSLSFWLFSSSFWQIKRRLATRLVIHVYAVCWNEGILLPYFLRHYSKIADKIYIYDNISDDDSMVIIKSFPNTEVVRFNTMGEYREDVQHQIRLNAWKKSRGLADWVIVVDIDEILYHNNLIGYLGMCKKKGITIPITLGFDMISEALPTSSGMIYDEIKLGVFNKDYCKYSVFNPNLISEINYGPGSHWAHPEGRIIVDSPGELKLLHYRYISLDYVLKRYRLYRLRKGEIAKKIGYGWQYDFDSEAIENFNILKNRAVDVVM